MVVASVTLVIFSPPGCCPGWLCHSRARSFRVRWAVACDSRARSCLVHMIDRLGRGTGFRLGVERCSTLACFAVTPVALRQRSRSSARVDREAPYARPRTRMHGATWTATGRRVSSPSSYTRSKATRGDTPENDDGAAFGLTSPVCVVLSVHELPHSEGGVVEQVVERRNDDERQQRRRRHAADDGDGER